MIRKPEELDLEGLTARVLLHMRAGEPFDLRALEPGERAYARELIADVERAIARDKIDRAADPSLPPLQFDIPS